MIIYLSRVDARAFHTDMNLQTRDLEICRSNIFFLRNKTNESAKFQLAIILMCVSYCEIGYFAYTASSPSYSVWKRFE